jgi:zinc-binding alcohol dehydrogenase family protein
MMKAVGYTRSLPVSESDCLTDIELPDPVARGRDLLVQVKAVSVNPVDTKRRLRSSPRPGEVNVLGWDAAGVVLEAGQDAELFRPGDEVWYAGSIARPGTNSELHLVDERIVGSKPKSLGFAQAAALPLTTITAWELLFDRLGVPQRQDTGGKSLLIVGAAGGVGSILTQLARRLTNLTVIGTASRPETTKWVASLGAHHVIDHSKMWSEQLMRIGVLAVTYVASLTKTGEHYAQIVESLAPQGHMALIDDPGPIDITRLKDKSLALHWELMFTRSLFETPDMINQHHLLSEVAEMVDSSEIRTTFREHFGRINAENLRRAHAVIESGTAVGKIVLEGF